MTTKFTITRMVKTMMPMTKLPLITKLPNASMTWPAADVPSWPCARIRRVEARLSASRSMVAISSTVGKAENSSGVWMNSAVIRISTDRMIEIASAQIEQDRRQRQDQHDEDGQHADGERDVAALEQRADVAECRQLEAAGRGGRGRRCGGGDVAHVRSACSRNPWAEFAGFMVTGRLTDTGGDWFVRRAAGTLHPPLEGEGRDA